MQSNELLELIIKQFKSKTNADPKNSYGNVLYTIGVPDDITQMYRTVYPSCMMLQIKAPNKPISHSYRTKAVSNIIHMTNLFEETVNPDYNEQYCYLNMISIIVNEEEHIMSSFTGRIGVRPFVDLSDKRVHSYMCSSHAIYNRGLTGLQRKEQGLQNDSGNIYIVQGTDRLEFGYISSDQIFFVVEMLFSPVKINISEHVQIDRLVDDTKNYINGRAVFCKSCEKNTDMVQLIDSYRICPNCNEIIDDDRIF